MEVARWHLKVRSQSSARYNSRSAGLLLRSLSQERENETFRLVLALARLEPRHAEHMHMITSRLGYGGVTWCAHQPRSRELGRIKIGLVLAGSNNRRPHVK